MSTLSNKSIQQSDNNLIPSTAEDRTKTGGLPAELLRQLFRYLSLPQLGLASTVCRRWHAIIADSWEEFDLETLFPGFQVLDEKVWKKYLNLAAGGIKAPTLKTPPNKTLIPIINRLYRFAVENRAGWTLLKVPELSVAQLLNALRFPIPGDRPIPTLSTDCEFQDEPQQETIVLISNGLLVGTRNLPLPYHCEVLKNHRLEVSQLVTAVALLILKYLHSPAGQEPTRLLQADYTHALLDNTNCFIAGNFSTTGFKVTCISDEEYGKSPGIGALGQVAVATLPRTGLRQ